MEQLYSLAKGNCISDDLYLCRAQLQLQAQYISISKYEGN